jgi:hypothetical protein
MSSRARKKRIWREEKERLYQSQKQCYGNILHNLEEIRKAKEEGRGIETINWGYGEATVTATMSEESKKNWDSLFEEEPEPVTVYNSGTRTNETYFANGDVLYKKNG